MAKPGALQIDEAGLLKAIVRSKSYGDEMHRRAVAKSSELQKIGSAYYQATLDGASQLFQQGAAGADSGRQRLSVRLPSGRNAHVGVEWHALSKKWRKDKLRRGRRGYSGPNPSYGAGKFWLDTGALREAFAGWVPGRGIVIAVKPRIRLLGGKDHQITYTLEFKKLPVRFLDAALRRALVLGAVAGRRVIEVEEMPKLANMPRRGLYRGFWPEALRPTMRPLAMRLGRAMQEQILKSLRRR